MDFTALELGLRNRQLLQVKCFLRIQIESKFEILHIFIEIIDQFY